MDQSPPQDPIENEEETAEEPSEDTTNDENEPQSIVTSVVSSLLIPDREEPEQEPSPAPPEPVVNTEPEESENQQPELITELAQDQPTPQEEESDYSEIEEEEEEEEPPPPIIVKPPPRRVRPPQRHSSTSSPRFSKSLPTKTELRTLALNLQPIPTIPDAQYDELINDLVEERRQFAQSRRYRDSTRVNKAIKHIESEQLSMQKKRLQNAELSVVEEMEAQFQSSVSAFDRETNKAVVELKEKQKGQLAALEENQVRDMAAFKQKWTAPSKVRQYNHASSRLRDLRKQYKLLMLSCQFDDAEQVEKLVKAQELSEQRSAHAAMQHDYATAFSKLAAKQNNEKEFLETKHATQVKSLILQRNVERQSLLRKELRLNAEKERVSNRERLWNSYQMERQESSVGKAIIFSSRMNEEDIDARDDATITLPPLDLLQIEKSNRRI